MKELEILAPAGSVSRMKAAFMAGADACYIGGNKFGARAFADNPTEDELIDAIGYAHFHKKKLFLAVNTLLKEKELKGELYEYILPYYEVGVDAVIVQDLGVLRFLSREFPDLPLHISTQMTVCDSSVMEELKKYNVERLVLSRELSLKEIADFKATGLEIECFVHGALCVCYSGQCSMSYFNGGRSGNRGSCAGPCRVEYDIYGEKQGKALKGESYLLSPKDICSIDHIPEMAEAGIYSFKIEGRMKSPQYAALTSSLYRKWANFYLEQGKAAFHEKEAFHQRQKDIMKLSDLYNRGSFTSGYLFLHNGKEMMADRRPNHNGVPVGKVKKVGSPKKKNVIQIETSESVNPQDVLEIREIKSLKPIYEFTLKDGYGVGETFQSNFTMGLAIREGMEVYRTKNAVLLSEITDHFINSEMKRNLKMRVKAKLGEKLEITFLSEGFSVILMGDTVEEAKNKPLDKSRIIQALLKLGDTEFVSSSDEIEVEIGGEIFFPISILNDFRRQGTKKLRSLIINSKSRNISKISKSFFEEDKTCFSGTKPKTMFVVNDATKLDYILSNLKQNSTNVEFCFDMDFFPRALLSRAIFLTDEKGHPSFIRLPMIFRSELASKFEEYFLSEKGLNILSHLRGFLIRNLEGLAFVKNLEEKIQKKFLLISDTNLHVFNSEAASCLAEMGFSSYTMSLEHSLEEALDTRNNLSAQIEFTMVAYGREELMITAQCQWKNKGKCVKELSSAKERLPDILYLEQKRKGKNGKSAVFPVAKNCESCHNFIFMEEPLNYLRKKSELSLLIPDRLRIDFTFESEKEIREVLKLAKLSQ